MKRLFPFLIAALLMPFFAAAQMNKDVVHWKFSAIKKDKNTWTITAQAKMDAGYHIWALDAGGDGSLIATAINIAESEDVELIGDWKESKKPVEQTYEFVDGAVRYFEHQVSFSQDIKAAAGTIITGTADFQTCNDKMCFPPDSEAFSLTLK